MSVSDNQVTRQCLSLLPLKDFVAPFLDYRKQKLTTENVLKIFITAQLLDWRSLEWIEMQIRSDEQFQKEFNLSSISKSQLSRRINEIPVELSQALFYAVVDKIQKHTHLNHPGTYRFGKPLALVDSTNIRLPHKLADWAYVTQYRSGIKVHTRLLVIDEQSAYPDKIVPSTGNVSDHEGSDLLVVDSDVLYVMDRGYVCYKRMQKWVTDSINFVVRVNMHHYAEILEERDIPETEPFIKLDATVRMGNNANTAMTSALRLIEFVDEQGRYYRIATTRWDLSAKEITEIYRHRWLIELFFKWMKQHLRFAQLYSYQPEAVWNHIFLALVAYGLTYLVLLETRTKKTIWEMLALIRIYFGKKWSELQNELNRKPSRISKGRPKGPPRDIEVAESEVAIIKKSKKRR